MELVTVTKNIVEPITVDEVKGALGYPATDQDAAISKMISAAREFLERRTALSLVEKNYQAYFEKDECDEDGWYELPVSPVNTTKAISVTMSGSSTTFQQKGIKRIKINPDVVFGTLVSETSDSYYMVADFWAGASDKSANDILLGIVQAKFNHRDESEGVNAAILPFGVLQSINQITMNL